MKNQKIRRKHRKLKNKVVNGITYIATIMMFICLMYYALGGYTPFLFGAVGCLVWCMLYAWANDSFKPITRKER